MDPDSIAFYNDAEEMLTKEELDGATVWKRIRNHPQLFCQNGI